MVQRRQDGSVDFNRTWLEYEDGFGKLTGEFWYGLRALHCLTGQGGWEMRMDIKLANGTNIFLQYEQFKVASAKDKYKLTVEHMYSHYIVAMCGISFSVQYQLSFDHCVITITRGNAQH